MRLCRLLVACASVTCILAQTLVQETCDMSRMKVDVDVNNADALIGGLFEMRIGGENGYGCGEPHLEEMLAYEAARWAISKINSDNYVPGIKLGMKAYDVCYSMVNSLSAVNDFYPEFNSASMYCNDTGKVNLGFVGGLTSWTTKPAAMRLSQFPASIISPAASSPMLSNKAEYPYFLRTTPSASEQIEAMTALMRDILGWGRIIIVYGDNDYGHDAMKEFVRQSYRSHVCVVDTIAVPDSPMPAEYLEKLADIGKKDVNGAIYFGDHYTLEQLMKSMDAIYDESVPFTGGNIQWIVSYTNIKSFIVANRIKGAIYVQPEFTKVTEFFDYFTSQIDVNNPPPENPWYRDWFMQTFKCRLTGVTYEPYGRWSPCDTKTQQDKLQLINQDYAYVDSTVKAVYAYAKALKQAQSSVCGSSGLCLGLQRLSPEEFNEYLHQVSFDMSETGITSLSGKKVEFDANGDFVDSGHIIWNYNDQVTGRFNFQQVGTYSGGALNVDVNSIYMYSDDRASLLPTLPASQCPAEGCINCVVPRPMVSFNFMPGDVVVGGLFDIHAQGSEILTCGNLKASHAMNAVAFKYALQTAKTVFPGILNGIELGSLIVDLCDNAETGRLFLNNVLGGRHIVSSPNGFVDPNKIQGVFGELDSTEATSMAYMLGAFNMPYIESAATSVYLSMKDMFPTFTRALPADDKQMHAIILLLKRYGWTHIQVVHGAGNYGRSGFELLRRFGARNGICIAAAHELESMSEIPEVVADLKKTPNAKAVVTVIDGDENREMLQEIQAQSMARQFVLVGTETWGQKQSVIEGLESTAEGSVSIDVVSPSVTGFKNWINTLDASNMDVMQEMPYFTEWYQYAHNCYLDATNRGIYQQECQSRSSITSGPNYEDDTYTGFTISASYALFRAIDETLKDVCGGASRVYDGICSEFRSNQEVKEKILGYLQNSEFSVNSELFKMRDGEGQANYNIYTVNSGQYRKIATYVTSEGESTYDFSSPLGLPAGFESQCSGFCSECVYLLQAQPFALYPSTQVKIGVNVGLHNPGTNDPFLCNSMRLTDGFQSALAIMYALDQVNNGNAPVSPNGVELGAIIFDHCNSPTRAYGLPSALYSGILEAQDGEERVPKLNTIRGWLTDNMLVTENMKDFFTDFNLPVMSPMATNNMFLNDDEYPTFVRMIQGDSTIASAIATLSKSLGLSYVAVVYSADSFGRQGVETFSNIALQEGVCVIKMVEMGSATPETMVQDLIDSTTHVVVTYLGQDDMRTFLTARGQNTRGNNLVVISPEPHPLVYKELGNLAQNVMSLQMKTGGLTDFLNYLRTIHPENLELDTDLKEYYMDMFQCNLPGEFKYSVQCNTDLTIPDSSQFATDNYILPFINSVYTFAAAVHETLKLQCGNDYEGVCANFYSDPDTNSILLSKIKTTSFVDDSGATFQFVGKEGNTGREIVLYNGNQMVPVADFAGASINFLDGQFQRQYEDTRSTCQLPCTGCINNMMNFTMVPGDIMLGGIFDVHEADLVPFSCGEINTLRGFQLLEAFHFALDQVNDKTGMFANVLKDVRLGGIGLDACQSAVRGGYLVSNIHNGRSKLERNGRKIDPDDIEAYIGPYSSGRSIYLARLFKSLKVPQVSYGATSVHLLESDRYPYFLRTVPSDDRQAMAMLDFLLEFNIRYVQVVHTADNYGEQGAAIFNQLAVDKKICVAQTVSYPYEFDLTEESANDVVLALLEKPIANTVIIFADSKHINMLLQAIRRNPEAPGKFRFIGSDTWANNKESTDGVENLALGSVTLDLDVVDLREFDDYLSTKTPANYPENPWFPEYYERIHNCYLTIPDGRYPTRCQAAPQDIVASNRYKQDTAIIHVINGVYAAAIGIDQALRSACGDDYSTVCEAFKNLDNRRDLVLEKIKMATFTDMSEQQFSFSDRGDGNKGYVLYSIDTSTVLGYAYNPIAKYSSAGELSLTDAAYMPSWDGSCERPDSCTECPTIRNPGTRYMLTQPSNNNPTPATLVAILAIHGQGNDEYQCGSMSLHNMVRALAIKYAVESSLVLTRPFDLRTLILDNCNNQLRVDQDLFNLFTTGELCNSQFDSGFTNIDGLSVIGVVTSSSRFVVAANRVTKPLHIQLLSSSASSTALSDRWRYPYFARTVPPDSLQMGVIGNILKQQGWSYISVLYSADSYGINGFRTLRDIVNEGQYSCIGFAEALRSQATAADVVPVIQRLKAVQGIGVIVVIANFPRVILEALIAEGVARNYVLIGSDSWGTIAEVTEGYASQFAGAITLDFRDAFYNDFLRDLSDSITYDNRYGMPDDWFEEFYQHIHECRLPDATVSLPYNTICTKTEVLSTQKLEEAGVGLLDIAAVYAIKTGLVDFYRTHSCSGSTFAECMGRVSNSRDILFNNTLATQWSISAGSVSPAEPFQMDIGNKRYWNVGYRINYLMNDNSYQVVGNQQGDQFNFDDNAYDHRRGDGFVSACPEDQFCDCNYPEASQEQQVAPKYMRDHEPRNYFAYDEDTGKQVYEWPIWAIAVAVLTCIGLLACLLLFFFFLIFYPIKGGTTILGFMMMVGVLAIYAINFAFFYPASEATCGARRFTLGVAYAIAFAALLVKAIDNWRFKDSEYSVERYRGLTNPLALLIIAFGIVLVQCIIPIEWLILRHPTASIMDDSTLKHDWMWCDPHDFYDISLVLSMSFVCFLIIVTAVFSALAWDSDSNYFESRWIFVSCVCTAGCFLVWMVVSTNAGPPYRDPAIAIANFVNASALLILIPLRKLILLVQFTSDEKKDGIILDDPGAELYSTVYSNAAYQPDVFQADMSKPNSEAGY